MSKQEISIIKLMDGSTLVGKISYGEDVVNIEHPIELVPQVVPTPGGFIGEAINLRPWIAVAEEQAFQIERSNVITVANLQANFIPGYHRMVKSIYFARPEWRGDFIEDNNDFEIEEQLQELDLETLEELAIAVIEKKIH